MGRFDRYTHVQEVAKWCFTVFSPSLIIVADALPANRYRGVLLFVSCRPLATGKYSSLSAVLDSFDLGLEYPLISLRSILVVFIIFSPHSIISCNYPDSIKQFQHKYLQSITHKKCVSWWDTFRRIKLTVINIKQHWSITHYFFINDWWNEWWMV